MSCDKDGKHPVFVVRECSHCGEELFETDTCDCEDEIYESESCSCRFCFCMNETENGEVCSECRTGVHQG